MKSMKGSTIVKQIPQRLRIHSDISWIQRCNSEEQFFAVKNSSNTLRKLGLMGKKIQSLNLNFNIPMLSFESEKESPVSDCRTTNTDDSTIKDQRISFTQRKSSKYAKKDITLTETVEFDPEIAHSPVFRVPINSKTPQRKIKVEDFQIIKKIGAGSYSEVFSAIEINTGFLCSLKKIQKKFIQEEMHLVDVLIREIKIQSHLNHKNLVNLYGVFDDQDYIYLICQYCPCGDLFQLLRKKHRMCEQMELDEVSAFLRQICEGIEAMHNEYLMHRDIKPENVFLTLGNQVKLGDFGWSVFYGHQGMRNTQCGTPLYLAPELVGKQKYNQTVDIWAIGILAFQLLTGDSPFRIRTAKDLQKIFETQIDFSEIQDPIAQDFVKKLLEKDVDKRMDIEEVLSHPFLGRRD